MESLGKVLVADDHKPNACGMRDLLVEAGYTVRVSYSGEDALRAALQDVPDLVLLDVVMPGVSGIEVCRELKGHSVTRLTQRLAGLEAGADDFLNKPIDVSEFRTRVRSLLRVKRLTDDLESTEAIMTMLGHIVEARGICDFARVGTWSVAQRSRHAAHRRDPSRPWQDRGPRQRAAQERPSRSARAFADETTPCCRRQPVSNGSIARSGATDRALSP